MSRTLLISFDHNSESWWLFFSKKYIIRADRSNPNIVFVSLLLVDYGAASFAV